MNEARRWLADLPGGGGAAHRLGERRAAVLTAALAPPPALKQTRGAAQAPQ